MINPLDPPDIEAKRRATLAKVYRLLIEVANKHKEAEKEAEETKLDICEDEEVTNSGRLTPPH